MSAQTISSFGSSFTMFALPLLVYKLTGSALNLGLVTVAEYLPYLLFGIPIGAAVDRLDRKRIMVLADVVQAAVISSVPLLLALGLLHTWWIYAVGFLSSLCWIFFNTAEFAAIPSLAREEDLASANGRLQASYSAATISGPLAAGALVAFLSVGPILLFDAASFLFSALLVSRVRARFEPDDAVAPGGATAGLRYVLGHPVLRSLCLMMAISTSVGYTVYTQLVLFAKVRLDATDARVAILYAVGNVGMVVLALAASPLRRLLSFGHLAVGSIALGGAVIVLLSRLTAYWPAAVAWALVWGLVVLFQISSNTLMQEVVPNHLLGRVQSAVSVLSWSAIPLGALAGGLAVEATGDVSLVYAFIGAAIFVTAIAFSFSALGNAEKYPPDTRG